MERALKQRLIGAVVLVISGVVLIPLLLDGAGHNSRFANEIEIPPAPVIKMKSWDELKEIPANLPEASTSSKPADQSAARSAAEVVKKVKKISQPSIKAWALQLGSFDQQTNALVLQDQLRAKGYRAFVVKSNESSNTHYKVRIGPDLDRSKIEKIAKKLKINEKIESIVVTHP